MKNFKKYFIIPATPDQVFIALTNEATASLWSGEKAEIDARPGGAFSLWEGSIIGHFIETVPGAKIVQEWYFGDQEPASIVTIKLHDHKRGTSLELLHTNIPEEAYKDIISGWEETYMEQLIDFYTEDE